MKPSDNNPYTTPAADLASEIDITKRIQSIPRFTTWGVLGLTIITLGLYYTYWLYTRTNIINRVHDDKISMGLVYTVLGSLAAYIVMSILAGAYPNQSEYELTANVLNVAFSLSNLFWVFTVRNRIHQMTRASRLNSYWLGGFMTFLFQVLYLQYKINEYIDKHQTDSTLSS